MWISGFKPFAFSNVTCTAYAVVDKGKHMNLFHGEIEPAAGGLYKLNSVAHAPIP
jgi:hypothetical protein